MRYDTLVIGAGMSGIAAGIRLAHFGKRVAILERHDLWGGLNSFYTAGGRRFDVGLHALTNYGPRGQKGTPLARILRQLRIRHEELQAGEQGHSEIHLVGRKLRFSNDFTLLESDVAAAFPDQADGFARLARTVRELDLGSDEPPTHSAREELENYLSDPALREMLLIPACYYGSAREDDVDWYTFMVLFQSLFFEGLWRPDGGIRTILNLLMKRFKRAGGELCMGNGVSEVLRQGDRAVGVRLEDGQELEADTLLSCAGAVETLSLCGEAKAQAAAPEAGQLTFFESLSILDVEPADHGLSATTLFFSNEERLRYRRPEDLVDVASGVISVPNNFHCATPLKEGLVRLTVLADHDRWCALPQEEYTAKKKELSDLAIENAAHLAFDWRPHTVFRDTFTPRTIRHYTSRINGAVYGSPKKRFDGSTGIDGLYLCGTDQGHLGVVGAMVSGISIANRYGLLTAAN